MLKTPQGLFTQGKASLKLEIELATTSCFVVVRFGLRSSPGKARFLGEGRLAPVTSRARWQGGRIDQMQL